MWEAVFGEDDAEMKVFQRTEPIWILGVEHSVEGALRRYRQVASKLSPKELREKLIQEKLRRNKEAYHDFVTKVWFSYREGFPAIGASSYNSDAGWGCMLRTSQMMFCQGLLVHNLGRQWRINRKGLRPEIYAKVLRWFLDHPEDVCPYSLHNLLRHSACVGKRIGEWFGPQAACVVIKRCHDAHLKTKDAYLLPGLYMASDGGTVYLDKILQMFERGEGPSTARSNGRESAPIHNNNSSTTKTHAGPSSFSSPPPLPTPKSRFAAHPATTGTGSTSSHQEGAAQEAKSKSINCGGSSSSSSSSSSRSIANKKTTTKRDLKKLAAPNSTNPTAAPVTSKTTENSSSSSSLSPSSSSNQSCSRQRCNDNDTTSEGNQQQQQEQQRKRHNLSLAESMIMQQPRESWEALIIVVPVRLGVESVNENYISGLIKCLKLPQSLGFVGGRPRSSLYFVGFQGRRLLYLDPHTVQKAAAAHPLKTDLRRASATFHCGKLRTMKLDELDPSLALGFYCRDRAEFFHFWSSIEELQHSTRYPPFRVEAKAPSYDDFFDLDYEIDDDDDDDDRMAAIPEKDRKSKESRKSTKKAAQSAVGAEEKNSGLDSNSGDGSILSPAPEAGAEGSSLHGSPNRNGTQEGKNPSAATAAGTDRTTGASAANTTMTQHGGRRTRVVRKKTPDMRPPEAEFLVDDDGFVIL